MVEIACFWAEYVNTIYLHDDIMCTCQTEKPLDLCAKCIGIFRQRIKKFQSLKKVTKKLGGNKK